MGQKLEERVCPCCRQLFRPRRSRVTCCSKRCAALNAQGKSIEDCSGSGREGGVCGHCGLVTTQLGPNGLCFGCYRDRDVRHLYPSTRPGPMPKGNVRAGRQKRAFRPGVLTPGERAVAFAELVGIAKHFGKRAAYGSGLDADDCHQEAAKVLWVAVSEWDDERHPPLRVFAWHAVKWGILDWLRAERKRYRPNIEMLYRATQHRQA